VEVLVCGQAALCVHEVELLVLILGSLGGAVAVEVLFDQCEGILDVVFEPPVLIGVVEGAVRPLVQALGALLALAGLVDEHVVVVLLPAVGELAAHHLRAAALDVEIQVLKLLPVLAVVGLVLQLVVCDDPPSEVLLVVRVSAVQPVVGRGERTHHRLILEHEEMAVLCFSVQQADPELLLVVHEGAKRPVHALLRVLEAAAVARFKTVFVVHLLHDVVRVRTALRTRLEVAFLARVAVPPTPVLFRVVVNALLQVVVNLRVRTLLNFEVFQVARVCVICLHLIMCSYDD